MQRASLSRAVRTLWVCLLLYSSPLLLAQRLFDFSGSWQQDVSRSVPPRKSQRSRELTIRQTGPTLAVKTTTENREGRRTLDLKYEIGGQELVYVGLDGDEFHTKVHWDGESLVFDTIEHERGKEIVSKQTWTLAEDGKVLREVKQFTEAGEPAESVAIFNKE